jgi:hypothetical protein
MRRIFFGMLVIFTGCSAALPVVTEDDVRRVRTRMPTATLHTLDAGRQRYIDRCGGCHSLHMPSEFTEEEWRKSLEEMQSRSRTSDEEKELILLYIAAARRP